MIKKRLQLLAVVGALIATLLFFMAGQWPAAAGSLLLTVFLAYGLYRFGPVYHALRHLYRGDLEKCEAALKKIPSADKLRKEDRAYYYFCEAYLLSTAGKSGAARKSFEQALEAGLRMPTDQAVAHVSLADIYLKNGQKEKALAHLAEAKKLKHNKVVEEAIGKLEKAFDR